MVNRLGRKKVKQFSGPGTKTASIPLKNPEGVREEEKAGDVEGKPEARGGGERADGEETE